MLNIENYVSWSSRLFRYAKSRPKGKLIYNSIINGPYVRQMILEPSDVDHEVPVSESFHEQADDELTEKELKQVEANDQAIQTILLGLPKDIYAALDSCETAQEIWLHVQKDCSNLKFLNNLQPEWSRHVIIVHKTKDLHTADYTQLYDVLKYNQKELDDLRVEQVAKIQDPLALMENSNNPFNYPVFHPGIANQNGNDNVVAAQTEGNENRNNGNLIRCYNCRGLADLDEIEEVNSDCILMANLQLASTSGTQTDKAPIYDSDGSAEENAKLRSQLFDKVSEQKDTTKGVDITTKTSRPQPKSNTKNDRVPFAFKSSRIKKKEVEVKEHVRNLLLSKNKKHMSSECNNVKLSIRNDKPEIVCAMSKFVGDFKSLANEADASLAKHKALELEIERLLTTVDSTVTYTTVSSPYVVRSGDVSPGEDGPPVMPEDPYAYVVAAFQALPEPDYMPGPEEPEQAPPSPVYIPYVPEPFWGCYM
uniref:Uncharacterized protein n=1 Tax=Tanacetum cinerariifolium TaxID=118510 RepID=A0A6L2LKU3_TANCI|nr:hypothetical protein [Tanacetum cinerariifolium]